MKNIWFPLYPMAQGDSSLYDIFTEMIPDKEHEITSADKIHEASGENNGLELLEQLAGLYEKGILTEAEFNEKKREILSKI